MHVIVYPDEDSNFHVVGPYADEDAAQAALDKFAEVHDEEIDTDSYEIVEVEKHLKLTE